MAVSIYEVAAQASGTGPVTPTMSTHGTTADWIVYVVVQTANEPTTLTTANGFVELTAARIGTGTPGVAGSVGLQLFYQRAAGSTLSAPTIGDAGDHIVAQCVSTRDNWTGGDPWDALATAAYASSTSGSVPGATTQTADQYIFNIIGNATDTASSQASGWTNAALTFVGPEGFAQATDGVGGGFNIGSGAKATAGAYGATTVTLATASAHVGITLALSQTSTPGLSSPQSMSPEPATSTATGVSPVLVDQGQADAAFSAGTFDRDLLPRAWFSPEARAVGWFTNELLTVQFSDLRPNPAASTATGVDPTWAAGAVSTTAAPATSTATGVDPVLSDVTLQIGAHGLDFQLFGHGNGPSEVTLTTTSGSMLLVFVGGNTTDLTDNPPTDNKGNTFRRIDSVRGYPTYPQWSTAVYAAYNITGGSSHTVSQFCQDFEESTLVVVEVIGGKVVRSIGFTQLSMNTPSTTHVGPNVVATGPAIEFQVWWGESGVGSDHTAVPNNGLTVIESMLEDDPDGYIQNATAWAAKTSGTHGTTWTVSPSQGFGAWGLIVQGEEVLTAATSQNTAVLPTLQAGAVSLTVAPATSANTAVDPTFTTLATPAPQATTTSATTPTPIIGAVTRSPSAAATTTSTTTPTFVPGAVSRTPAPVATTSAAVTPSSLAGAVTRTATATSTTTQTTTPATQIGTVSRTVSAVASTTSTTTPTPLDLRTPAPSNTTSSAVSPLAQIGAVSRTPVPAGSTTVAISPSTLATITRSVAPQSTTSAATTPVTVLGSVLRVPAAQAVTTSTTTPSPSSTIIRSVAAAVAISTTTTPTANVGAVSRTPSPAISASNALSPTVAFVRSPSPVVSTSSTVAPVTQIGSVSRTPAAVQVTTQTVEPLASTTGGSVVRSPAPASSTTSAQSPTSLAGSLTRTPVVATTSTTTTSTTTLVGAVTRVPLPSVTASSTPTPVTAPGAVSRSSTSASVTSSTPTPSTTNQRTATPPPVTSSCATPTPSTIVGAVVRTVVPASTSTTMGSITPVIGTITRSVAAALATSTALSPMVSVVTVRVPAPASVAATTPTPSSTQGLVARTTTPAVATTQTISPTTTAGLTRVPAPAVTAAITLTPMDSPAVYIEHQLRARGCKYPIERAFPGLGGIVYRISINNLRFLPSDSTGYYVGIKPRIYYIIGNNPVAAQTVDLQWMPI